MENKVSNPNAWIFFANNSIEAAETLINNPNLTGEAAVLCQQAIEKYLKAYLTKLNIPFRKTHDLVDLYLKIKSVKDLSIDEALLQDVRDLYIDSRYPDSVGTSLEGSLLSIEDTKSYLNFAKKVASVIKAEME
jgi:HEPN domain-containing protein